MIRLFSYCLQFVVRGLKIGCHCAGQQAEVKLAQFFILRKCRLWKDQVFVWLLTKKYGFSKNLEGVELVNKKLVFAHETIQGMNFS